MAQYSVTRSCGHDEIVNLIGPHKNREWRLENVEPNKLCHSCYIADLEQRKAKATAEAIEAASEMELPALAGTEKQIAWAEKIRQDVIARAEGCIYGRVPEAERETLLPGFDELQQIESARWWINHRDITLRELEKLMLKTAKEQEEKPLADAAKIEATVRPEKPVTETVAEIRALENCIEVHFPEKRDDFREIVKVQLGMEWSVNRWTRKLVKINGTPADRAAEAGHRLLAAGFPVRIFDDETRQKAITGTYGPEHTRWIMCRVSGDYLGYLSIKWGRKEDFYRAAKGIKRSRYYKSNVVVPPEYFDEVLDFAQLYDFRISESAQKAIDVARQARESMLVVNVVLPIEKEHVVVSGKPPVLEVPAEVDVADEFRD